MRAEFDILTCIGCGKEAEHHENKCRAPHGICDAGSETTMLPDGDYGTWLGTFASISQIATSTKRNVAIEEGNRPFGLRKANSTAGLDAMGENAKTI